MAREVVTEKVKMCQDQHRRKEPVLVRVTVAVTKHNDQKQNGERRIYLTYTSTSPVIPGGSQDRSSDGAGA